MKFDGVVVISNEPWGDIWYCKQHYAHELAKLGYRLYFIDPVTRWRFRDLFSSRIATRKVEPNLMVLSYDNNFPVRLLPKLFVRLNDWFNSRKLRRYFKGQRLLWWQFDHIRLISLHGLNVVKRIYHVEDPHMKAPNNDRLARSVDLIVCTSHKYLPHYAKYKAPKLHVPHCISSEEFTVNKQRLQEIRDQYGDFMILIGTITVDLDLELLKKLLERIETSLLIIGPVATKRAASKPQWNGIKSRAIYIGPVHAKELKNYIAAASVCLIPYRFDLKKAVGTGSPLKALAYLGQYKPIITSIDSEIQSLEGSAIYRAVDREDFIRFTQKGLGGQLDVDQEAVDRYLSEHTYEAGIEKILSALVK